MKLLFDQNLSFKLVAQLSPIFSGSRHVQDFELSRASDDEMWGFAKENDFAIVSKDSDFLQRALLRGHPPKLIYVRVGNATTQRIGELLLGSRQAITDFLSDPVESALTIG